MDASTRRGNIRGRIGWALRLVSIGGDLFWPLAPPAPSECGHRVFASWPCVGVRPSWCGKVNVHIHGDPTGAALALKMRPTVSPADSTSKSSSFHSPDRREAGARLR